jgi:hypothetical protein
MTQQGEGREGGLRFLDGLARLFHGRAEKPAAAPPAEAPGDGEPALGPVETEFEAALRALHATIEAQRASRPGPGAGTAAAPVDRRAQQKRRMEAAHRAIRADVVAKHAALGTGIGEGDLDAPPRSSASSRRSPRPAAGRTRYSRACATRSWSASGA